MPRAQWALCQDRPAVQIMLTMAAGGQQVTRNLLADTGAGTARVNLEIVLEENDCLLAGGIPVHGVILGGAYAGSFPVYRVRVQLPSLGFDHFLRAVGVPTVPAGFDGIACFRFLNHFTYGNFGNRAAFGLET